MQDLDQQAQAEFAKLESDTIERRRGGVRSGREFVSMCEALEPEMVQKLGGRSGLYCDVIHEEWELDAMAESALHSTPPEHSITPKAEPGTGTSLQRQGNATQPKKEGKVTDSKRREYDWRVKKGPL
jgi:hypothetical protein